MDFQDYYETMGVARDATQDDIKRAYRKLARKYHPDVSDEAGAEDKFKTVGEAYEVLKDPEKRAAYDQLGSQYKAGQDFRPPPDWGQNFEFRGGTPDFGSGGGDGADFSDFFSSLFGQMGGGGPRQPGGRGGFQMQGEDHHASISIDVADSYSGVTRGISLRMPEVTPDGHVVTRDRTLNVKIPQGVRPGQRIRLTGQGGPSMSDGKAGDLYLEIEFNTGGQYRVENSDVSMTLPVAPWEAALGATVTVPIPSGSVDLKIPAGSSQGNRLRLKGKGLPAKTPGDFYVELKVVLPPADSDEAKALYEKMRDEIPFDPRADSGRS
jgi:curved DNA-binding protein